MHHSFKSVYLKGPRACSLDCACEDFNGIGVGGDSKLSADERRKFAIEDFNGVLAADLVWLLAENSKGACGSWFELGAAVTALHLRVVARPITVVSGPKWQRSIFRELCDHKFYDEEAAFDFVAAQARQ